MRLWYSPKFRRDPNEMVHSLYYGVAPGGKTVTRIVKRSPTEDRLETSRDYGPGIPRGQGGQIAVLILGGMETTLDEIEDILAAKKEKKWVPKKNNREIADMCHHLLERRNDAIKYFLKNPSEAPQVRKPVLHLPVGCKFVQTPEPGLKVLARI